MNDYAMSWKTVLLAEVMEEKQHLKCKIRKPLFNLDVAHAL